jgi:C-terminal processing protease CtpA/Prc
MAFVLNLDMIGRLRSDHLIIVGTRMGYGLRRLASEQNEGGNLLIEFPWEIKANADHFSFYERQIPALTIHTGEHEDYHRPSDKAAKINRDGMRRVAQFAFQTLYELANSTDLTGYREAARSESKESEKSLLEGAANPPDRLGATYQTLERGAPGALLTAIVPGSPADRAGLQLGDRVVRFAGQAIASAEQLSQRLQSTPNPIEVQVWRASAKEPRKLTLELDGNPMRIGIAWRVDDAEPGILLLSYVLPDSPAAKAGLAIGDRIYRVAGRNFADEKEFAQRIRNQKNGPIELSVERDGRIRRAIIRFAAEELKRAA